MSEITLHGATYRTGRLNAFQQLHVSRKLLPLLGALVESLKDSDTGDLKAGKNINFARLMETIGGALSALSQEETEFVVTTCMAVVTRQQGQVWAPIWNARANAFLFDDIEMPDMLQLTFQVVQENLGRFFPVPQSSSGNPGLTS